MNAFADRWNGWSTRERAFVACGAIVVLAALAWAFLLDPLARALPEARRDADRAALALEAARRDAASAGTRATPAARAPLEAGLRQVLAQRGLDAGEATIAAGGARTTLTVPSIGFDALVGLVDALAREQAIHVAEARILPRVEAGRVRAELVLAR